MSLHMKIFKSFLPEIEIEILSENECGAVIEIFGIKKNYLENTGTEFSEKNKFVKTCRDSSL